MTFWTLLASGIFFMILVYLIVGANRIWMTLFIYTVAAVTTALLFYFLDQSLYVLDIFALLIPVLIILPLHISIRQIFFKHFSLDDNQTSLIFIAQYNRFLSQLWIFEAFLLVGLGLAFIDAFYSGFDVLNIVTMSIIGFILIVIPGIVVYKGYKKTFSFILVVGNKKKVYKYHTNKARLFIKKTLGDDYDIYQRGMFNEDGENIYIYYLKDDVVISDAYFKPYESKLIDILKENIESSIQMKEAYREYIENEMTNEN